MGIVVLSLAAIPLSVLVSALWDPNLGRRSRFWLRFGGLVFCMVVPWIVALVAALGEQVQFVLLCLGLAWALVLVALAPVLLFGGPGSDSGSSDDGGPGRGPDDDRRPPHRPIGGIPLPDAEQSTSRLRGPHTTGHPLRTRRGARERERRPARMWQMRRWPSLRHPPAWHGTRRPIY
jgi:hypothetical protein